MEVGVIDLAVPVIGEGPVFTGANEPVPVFDLFSKREIDTGKADLEVVVPPSQLQAIEVIDCLAEPAIHT